MQTDDIGSLPIQDVAAKDCTLFLWAINPMLPHALETMERWGFTFKTIAFTWAKTTVNGKWHIGLGYWTRANTELCLLGTRGKPKRIAKDVRQLVVSQRREHSRKPDEIAGHIERLTHGPYLELFSRTERPNWTVWGNETGKFLEGHALAISAPPVRLSDEAATPIAERAA